MPTDCSADSSCHNTNEYNESPNSFEVMLFEYPKNIGKIKLHKWRDQVWNIIPKLIQFQKTAKVGGVGKILTPWIKFIILSSWLSSTLHQRRVNSKCISHSWALYPETWDIYPCFLENMPKFLGMIFEKIC